MQAGNGCESNLAKLKLWVSEHEQLVKLWPSMAEFGTEAWAKMVVVPVFQG